MIRKLRKAVTWLALVVMVTLIVGYIYVTDHNRVRRFAEETLSRELGASVTVGDARLSIFEGLRLDNLRIAIAADDPLPLFQAKRVHVSYDPRALLRGRVAAERVVAVEPTFRLIEDTDQKRWNFQRLQRGGTASSASRGDGSGNIPELPEILIRNARFDYVQIENGRETEVGTLHLEGAFTPTSTNDYRFRVQSRGGAERAFPVAEGSIKSDRSAVGLVVNDVEFVDEIKSILPAEVRRLWEEFKLAGRLNEVRLELFRKANGRAGYRVTTDLAGVALSVPPVRWMGPSDRARVTEWQETYRRLGGRALGGSGVSRSLVDSMTPEPLRLNDVEARLVFTDERVTIERLRAQVDNNALEFTGVIDGYTADAAVDLRVASPPGQDIVFPEKPNFVASMPWPVQEIYYRFKPVGRATFGLNVKRAAGSEQPTLSGELDIHEAQFEFDRVPYPVERAKGKLRFGNDPKTGREMLELVNITGHGQAAGPNANAVLSVNGTICPLDESAGADIRIAGRGVTAERRLLQSLPPLTQQAVMNFDANRTGRLPTFDGDFAADVHRAIGVGQPWLVTTTLDLRNAAGVFKGFPYPLHGVSGSIKIHEDHVDVTRIKMPVGTGTADLSGAISWAKRDPKTDEPLIQPDLSLSARGVPIDDTLLAALPASKRGFLARLGLSGKLDIDGKITASAPDSEEPLVDLKAKLTDGTAKPPAMALAVENLRAAVRVYGERADVDSFDGTVAGAELTGRASVDAAGREPRVSVEAKLASLSAQDAPLGILPADAATAVRSLHAKGRVDVELIYAGEDDYRVTVLPKDLTVTPDIVPLTFKASGGRAVVVPGTVRLEKMTARVGDAPVSLDGTVDAATGDTELSFAARDMMVDAATTKALPAVLQEVVRTLDLSGPVSIDCRKIKLRQATTQPVAAAARTDFDATLWLQKASMQVAADVQDVVGRVTLRGQVNGDDLARLDGKLVIDSATFAGRPATRLIADLAKRPGEDLLSLTNLTARVAGGQIAGRIETVLNKRDPRYALELLIRGAKVAELTGETENPIEGSVNASLSMEGRWDDARTRRGRGDVLVTGKEMARVPLVFGFMQIANLAVPNNEPIRQAGLRYTVEGPIIRMDQIDLRSTKGVMAGDGVLDFDRKTVQFDLALADSAADAIPLFGDLIKSTRQDLMRLRIRGSLAGGKDGAKAFNIFNSTVDEVKKGK